MKTKLLSKMYGVFAICLLASTVSVGQNPAKIVINFTGFSPHVGKYFGLRALHLPDSGFWTSKSTSSLSSATFSDSLTVINGSGYLVQFYADMNGNNAYDAPPTDHAWQIVINNLSADTLINYAHNTNFTDVKWRSKVWLNLTGMTPHVGQYVWLGLIDKSTMNKVDEKKWYVFQANGSYYTQADIQKGKTYDLDFFVDFNNSGTYNAPPVDHAWRIPNITVVGDTTIVYAHNTNFTDIQWVMTSVNESLIADLKISAMPNPFSKTAGLSIESAKASTWEVLMYNSLGQVLYSSGKQSTAGAVYHPIPDSENLQPGLYFLTVVNEHGQRESRKVIKQ